MEKVESCLNTTKIQEFPSICENLEYLTNNCTMPLETCNDETAMEKIKANYLENYIFDIWDFVIFHTSVKQLSTRDKENWEASGLKKTPWHPFPPFMKRQSLVDSRLVPVSMLQKSKLKVQLIVNWLKCGQKKFRW